MPSAATAAIIQPSARIPLRISIETSAGKLCIAFLVFDAITGAVPTDVKRQGASADVSPLILPPEEHSRIKCRLASGVATGRKNLSARLQDKTANALVCISASPQTVRRRG